MNTKNVCALFAVKINWKSFDGVLKNYAMFFGGGNCIGKQLLNKRSE